MSLTNQKLDLKTNSGHQKLMLNVLAKFKYFRNYSQTVNDRALDKCALE